MVKIKILKLSHFLLVGVFISISQSTAASNPAKEMMKNTEEMIKSSKEAIKAGNESIQKAIDQAAKDVKSAADKLHSFKIPPLTQNGEPEQPSIDFKWSVANIQLSKKGDAKRGEELAKKGKCSKCHGETGVSEDDYTPSIAGQIITYSIKQLHDYKVGLRKNKSMSRRVRDLSLEDMTDISTWYAAQTPEKMLGVKKGAKPPALAHTGDPERHMLACNTCHNDDAMKRGYQIPILEGQKVEYFKETMLAFKEGERVNDHYNLMRSLSARLTEEEINELAEYYSAKPMEEEE